MIGSIDPSISALAQYGVPAGPATVPGEDLTTGKDGNLWFTVPDTGAIGVFSPTAHTSAVAPTPTAGSVPGAITSGLDGTLWFTETGTIDKVGVYHPVNQDVPRVRHWPTPAAFRSGSSSGPAVTSGSPRRPARRATFPSRPRSAGSSPRLGASRSSATPGWTLISGRSDLVEPRWTDLVRREQPPIAEIAISTSSGNFDLFRVHRHVRGTRSPPAGPSQSGPTATSGSRPDSPPARPWASSARSTSRRTRSRSTTRRPWPTPRGRGAPSVERLGRRCHASFYTGFIGASTGEVFTGYSGLRDRAGDSRPRPARPWRKAEPVSSTSVTVFGIPLPGPRTVRPSPT